MGANFFPVSTEVDNLGNMATEEKNTEDDTKALRCVRKKPTMMMDKGGENTYPSNFRPISASVHKYLKNLHISNSSTIQKIRTFFYDFISVSVEKVIQPLESLLESLILKKAIDNNLYTCGIFLNFSKAFDTVDHTLLEKLEAYARKKGGSFEIAP